VKFWVAWFDKIDLAEGWEYANARNIAVEFVDAASFEDMGLFVQQSVRAKLRTPQAYVYDEVGGTQHAHLGWTVTEPRTVAALAGEHLAAAYSRLGDITNLHYAYAAGGSLPPRCRECGHVHPCKTYRMAKGEQS